MPSVERLEDIAAGQTLTLDNVTAKIGLDVQMPGGCYVQLSYSRFGRCAGRGRRASASVPTWFVARVMNYGGRQSGRRVVAFFHQFFPDAAVLLQVWLA